MPHHTLHNFQHQSVNIGIIKNSINYISRFLPQTETIAQELSRRSIEKWKRREKLSSTSSNDSCCEKPSWDGMIHGNLHNQHCESSFDISRLSETKVKFTCGAKISMNHVNPQRWRCKNARKKSFKTFPASLNASLAFNFALKVPRGGWDRNWFLEAHYSLRNLKTNV